jgi:26S proteasome regulatory subunit N12
MYMMIGLNLIHLLSLNRIADFHTELETLSDNLTNIYIKHPLQIEQCLMEGLSFLNRKATLVRKVIFIIFKN